MSTRLSDTPIVESLKRAIAVPGAFAETFPSTTDPLLADTLMDGFALAQLDGFLSGFSLTVNTKTVDPDLSTSQRALVVMYAAAQVLNNELANRLAHVRYEGGGGTVFEEDYGASVLVERMRQIEAAKQRLLDQLGRIGRGQADVVLDAYFIRATTDYGDAGLSYADAWGL